MKKVLVIGGNGFIGKNIVDYLVVHNYEVGIYDLSLVTRAGVRCYQGDILGDKNLENIIKVYDVIIYLISAIMPQESMDKPTSAYLTDIPLLLKVLEICKKFEKKRIIYSSSGGTIYGESKDANSEEICGHPECHYGICKHTCENILLLYNKLFSMENIILRLSNPYGLYQNSKNGVGVITAMTLSAIKDQVINIWGDGENIRDFVKIEDVVNGFAKAIDWKFEQDCIPIFNIGSGKPVKINDIAHIISDEIEGVTIKYLPKRNFDVRCNYLNILKAKQMLKYEESENVLKDIRDYVKCLVEGKNEIVE